MKARMKKTISLRRRPARMDHIIDFLTTYPDARRRVVRLLVEIDAG